MCSTSRTAACKSLGKPATTRMTAAGPPVDAAITTSGNFVPLAAFWCAARSAPLIAADGCGTGACAVSFDMVAVRTTRTFAAIFSLRVSSSRILRMSRSMPLVGLGTKSMAPSSRARRVLAAPSRDSELTITTGRGCWDMISSVACRPSRCGMLMSMVITSGRRDSARATASRPSRAVPATSSCASELMISFSTLHMKAESSATRTRIFFSGALIISILPHRNVHGAPFLRFFRAYQFIYGCHQLIFLHGLGQKCGGAFSYGAIAMFCAGAGGDDQDRNFSGDGILAQMGHQLVAVHAWHFEVGYDQVTADLGDEFGGFEPVGCEFHAIAGFFEHASDEFADADGIIGDDYDAIVLDRIHGASWNAARGDCFRARSENAGCGRRGWQRVAFSGVRGREAIQIDQENQAAIGRDGCAGKEFHAAEIVTEILDDDFVLAEDFFDDDAHLFSGNFYDDHVEITVQRFERRESELDVEADDLGNDVADAGEKFSADVFDFIGLEAANFFDYRKRQSEYGCAATHEERLRDD